MVDHCAWLRPSTVSYPVCVISCGAYSCVDPRLGRNEQPACSGRDAESDIMSPDAQEMISELLDF